MGFQTIDMLCAFSGRYKVQKESHHGSTKSVLGKLKNAVGRN